MGGIALKTFNPFPDLDYCNNGTSECSELDPVEWKCEKFPEQSLVKNNMLHWFYKCQACKDRYQRNKK
jgi:hypothetical protein